MHERLFSRRAKRSAGVIAADCAPESGMESSSAEIHLLVVMILAIWWLLLMFVAQDECRRLGEGDTGCLVMVRCVRERLQMTSRTRKRRAKTERGYSRRRLGLENPK